MATIDLGEDGCLSNTPQIDCYTNDFEVVQSFFCFGLQPYGPFPFDRQSTYAMNKPVNQLIRKL
jgi:hypothetical protein